MITLASVIDQFQDDFLSAYQNRLRSNQISALQAMKSCRTQLSPVMQVNCADCDYQTFVPHSCGHRNCPHCQHYDKSAGKPICTASAARRVKVHGGTFMIVRSGLKGRYKNKSLLIIL